MWWTEGVSCTLAISVILHITCRVPLISLLSLSISLRTVGHEERNANCGMKFWAVKPPSIRFHDTGQ